MDSTKWQLESLSALVEEKLIEALKLKQMRKTTDYNTSRLSFSFVLFYLKYPP